MTLKDSDLFTRSSNKGTRKISHVGQAFEIGGREREIHEKTAILVLALWKETLVYDRSCIPVQKF